MTTDYRRTIIADHLIRQALLEGGKVGELQESGGEIRRSIFSQKTIKVEISVFDRAAKSIYENYGIIFFVSILS